jgi:hypothetical protein
MPSQPISPAVSVKLSAAGAGQISLGPPSGTLWQLNLAALSILPPPTETALVLASQGFLYLGSSSGPLTLIDSTFLGNNASSGKVAGAPLFHGTYIWAQWKGADALAVATLQLYGTQVTGYRQAAR